MSFTRLLLVGLAAVVLPASAHAQLTVSGRVTDAGGRPLSGAQVSIARTGIGTLTSSDGRYRLVIPRAAQPMTLEARFIGYSTRTRTLTQSTGNLEVDFALPVDALQMDEIVVTGASAETSRRQLGNAIGTVNARDLQVSASPAVDRALAGKVAGVMVQQNSGNPAGGITVRLRGVSTILGSAEPLYIVDGVIVNNDSPNLLYLGGYTQNRLVDLNPADIDRIEVIKGAQAAALYGSRANNGVVQIFTKRGTSATPRFTVSSRVSSDQIRKTLEVNRHPFDANGNPVTRYDHQDYIFRTAYGTENQLSVEGTAGGTRYYASGSFFDNQGIVRGSDFKRSTARVRLDQAPTDWATVSIGGVYSLSRGSEIPNGGLGALYGAIDGFLFGPNTFNPQRSSVTGLFPDSGSFANPAEVVARYDFGQNTGRIVGDVRLTLTPFEGFSVDYLLGYDSYTQTATGFIPRGTATPGIYALGWTQRSTRELSQLNSDINLRLMRTFSGIESVSLLGGTYQTETSANSGITSYDLSPVTQVVSGGSNRSINEFRSTRKIQGVFAQQTVGLLQRVYLTAAGRLDASSVFGEANRWQFYPKVSGSYLVSQENFWRSSSLGRIIPELKLRAAWGQSGGLTAIGAFDRFTNYSPISYETVPGLIPSRQQGTDIKPERQTGVEAGLDVSLFSNRAALEVTYYKQHTDDLLLTRTIAPSTGFSTRLQNAGAIDNRGLELLVRAVPLITSNLRWSTTATYAANRNKVSGIDGNVRILGESFGLAAAVNGEPLGVYYAAGYLRDAEGRILNTTGGVWTDPKTQVPARDATPRIIGDPNPEWIGSWINELDVGNDLSFRVQLDGMFGNDVWNYDRRIGAYPPYGTLKDYELELNGTIAKGTGTAVWTNFEHWVEDGTYVKVREVSASYMLHPRALGLEALRVVLTGRNLHSFDKYTGYDPEVNAGGQRTGTRGYVFGEVPIPRSISLGFTATF